MLASWYPAFVQGRRVQNQASPSSAYYHFLLTSWKMKEKFFFQSTVFFPAYVNLNNPLVLEACIHSNVANSQQKQSKGRRL